MTKDCEVLVVGAGYVGSRLLARLPAGAAIGLKRTATHDARQRMLTVNLDKAIPELPHARSIVYTVPPARDGLDDARLTRLLQSLKATPQRIVYFSSSGVYGDCAGQLVSETSEPKPITDRAKRRLSAEKKLSKWCADQRVELSILRVPGIYGPHRLRLDRLQEGEPVLREADAGPSNRIHVDDLVSCALAALDPARPAGIYNVGDGDNRSSTFFTRQLAELAGLPQPAEITLAEAKQSWSEMRLSFLNESRRLDVRRMQEVLEVSLAYRDIREGIRASLSEQKARD